MNLKKIDTVYIVLMIIWGVLYAWPVVHPWSMPGAYIWAGAMPFSTLYMVLVSLYGVISTLTYAYKKRSIAEVR